MENGKEYKFYKAFSRVNELVTSMHLVEYSILFIHMLAVFFFMLRNMQAQIQGSIPYVPDFIKIINTSVLSNGNAQIIWVVGLVGLFLMAFLLAIYFVILPNEDEIAENKKVQKVILITNYILAHSYQLIIYLIFWSYAELYQTQGPVFAFLKGFLPVAVYTYYNIFYQSCSLYRWFTFPLVIQLTIFRNALSYLFIICVSIYLLFKVKQLATKIMYGLVIVIAIFVMKNDEIFTQVQDSEMKIPFACLGILLVLTPILIFKLKQKLTFSSPADKIQNIIEILTQLKGETSYNEMKFNDFYQIYNMIINFSRSITDEKTPQIQAIIEKRPEQITRDNFFVLLQKYLEKECKKAAENNILDQILLLKVRMSLNYPMSTLVEKLFLIYEEMKRQNKNNHEEFFKMYDLVIKKFGIFNNGELESANIIYVNKLHQSFENRINFLLDKLAEFWECMSQQQVQKSILNSAFDKILDLEEELQNVYRNMEKIGTFQRERKLMEMSRTMLNAYEQGNKNFSSLLKKGNQLNENEPSHAFIILQNNIIKFVSKDLLKSLNENGSLNFLNVDKKVLFGEEFYVIIDNQIKNLDIKNQSEEITIPIFCRKGFMQLKKIKIIWYPSFETKNRYLIRFSDDNKLLNEAFVIYHCKTDTIRFFNQKVITHFNIDQQKFEYQLHNYQIFFNEIFINTDIPAEQIKNVLKEQQTIRCKIYLQKFVQAGQLGSIPVEIKAIKCIQIENEPTFCILKIKKLKQKKQTTINATDVNKQSSIPQKDVKFMGSNESMPAKKYQNEKFFCKIPNHYESKITQKQAQLEQSGRWVYRYFIHVVFGFLFTSILTISILEYSFMQKRFQEYNKFNLALENVSQQYALFYQAYSIALSRYYGQKYPEQIVSVIGVPGFVFDKIQAQAQQSFLDEFLIRYLTQINKQPNDKIKYRIDFNYFSIQTDTGKSTLMDFAENFRRHIATGEIDFLLKNYNNYRNLTILYEDSFSYEDQVRAIVAQSSIYFWVLMAMTTMCIILILYTLFRIEEAIDSVYSLISLISVKQLKKNLLKFNVKKQNILHAFDNLSYNSKGQDLENYKPKSRSEISSNYQFQQKSFSEQQKSFASFKTEEQNKAQQLNTIQNQNEINEKKSFLQIKSEKNDQKNIKIIDQSFIIKLFRKSFFFALLIIFSLVFLYEDSNLLHEQEGIIQTLNVKKQLYIILLHIKRQQVDAQMKPTLSHFYNKTIKNEYHDDQINLVTEIQNQIILDQLKDFVTKARFQMSQDLCKFDFQYKSLALKPCQNYLNGIVTKGLGEAFDIFKQNAKVVIEQNLQQFGQYKCTVEKCTPYKQHYFVSILMGEKVRSILTMLEQQVPIAFDSMTQKAKRKMIYKVLALLFIVLCYVYYDSCLKKRCKMAIKYFRIIPKEIICSIKITAYMRKTDALNKFDIL